MNVVTDFFGITNSKEDENESVNDTSVESSLEKQEPINEDDNDTLLAKDTDEEDDDENNDDGEDDNDALDDEEEGDDDSDDEDEDEDDDSDDEDLQKLQGYEEKNVLVDYHPEVVQISEEELQTYSKVVRDNNGKIVDPFHKTIPIMTKYEKAKVIGIRAQQINSGFCRGGLVCLQSFYLRLMHNAHKALIDLDSYLSTLSSLDHATKNLHQ